MPNQNVIELNTAVKNASALVTDCLLAQSTPITETIKILIAKIVITMMISLLIIRWGA